MLLKLFQAGEPVLRQSARELSPDEIRSPGVQQLIELMRETMRDAPGVGLAAPQIGESLALAVIEDKDDYQKGVSRDVLKERDRRPVPFHVIVNPKITLDESEGAVSFFEGCLSVAGLVAVVPRAREVRVDALDHKGNPVTLEARGWYARILQHEIDHLNGGLYVDRMVPRTLMTSAGYGEHWGHKPVRQVLAELGVPG